MYIIYNIHAVANLGNSLISSRMDKSPPISPHQNYRENMLTTWMNWLHWKRYSSMKLNPYPLLFHVHFVYNRKIPAQITCWKTTNKDIWLRIPFSPPSSTCTTLIVILTNLGGNIKAGKLCEDSFRIVISWLKKESAKRPRSLWFMLSYLDKHNHSLRRKIFGYNTHNKLWTDVVRKKARLAQSS